MQWFLDLSRKIGMRAILISTDDESCLFVDDHADALQAEFLSASKSHSGSFPIQQENAVLPVRIG